METLSQLLALCVESTGYQWSLHSKGRPMECFGYFFVVGLYKPLNKQWILAGKLRYVDVQVTLL